MNRCRLLATVLLALTALTSCGKEKELMAQAPDDAPVKEVVRKSALAGSWYSRDPKALAAKVDAYLDVEPWPGDAPRALIAPHAGHLYAGPMQGKVYKTVEGRSYGRVFILGVPHRARVRGVSIPLVTHYETPLGKVPVDQEAVKRLLDRGKPFHTQPRAHDREHSVEIHLPFLQRTVKDLKIVPMLVYVEPAGVHEVAAGLREVLRPGDLVIASSDNTHYGDRFGYTPFPPDKDAPAKLEKLDMGAVEKILALDLPGYIAYKEETDITTCGFCPICVLLALLPAKAEATLTGYDTSATVGGDWSSVVSYVGVAFTGPDWTAPPRKEHPLSDEEQALALRLARESMERYVRSGTVFDPKKAGWVLTPALLRRSGCFVTLTIDGKLRGCIGDIFPMRPLHAAIVKRAISSSAEDRRFEPVTVPELEKIRVEISVLSPPRPVESFREIEIGKHGIVLVYDGRTRSVYLPQVAPGQGWDLEQTLSSLSRKGGLPRDAWRSPKASFKVFTAQVFGEDD